MFNRKISSTSQQTQQSRSDDQNREAFNQAFTTEPMQPTTTSSEFPDTTVAPIQPVAPQLRSGTAMSYSAQSLIFERQFQSMKLINSVHGFAPQNQLNPAIQQTSNQEPTASKFLEQPQAVETTQAGKYGILKLYSIQPILDANKLNSQDDEILVITSDDLHKLTQLSTNLRKLASTAGMSSKNCFKYMSREECILFKRSSLEQFPSIKQHLHIDGNIPKELEPLPPHLNKSYSNLCKQGKKEQKLSFYNVCKTLTGNTNPKSSENIEEPVISAPADTEEKNEKKPTWEFKKRYKLKPILDSLSSEGLFPTTVNDLSIVFFEDKAEADLALATTRVNWIRNVPLNEKSVFRPTLYISSIKCQDGIFLVFADEIADQLNGSDRKWNFTKTKPEDLDSESSIRVTEMLKNSRTNHSNNSSYQRASSFYNRVKSMNDTISSRRTQTFNEENQHQFINPVFEAEEQKVKKRKLNKKEVQAMQVEAEMEVPNQTTQVFSTMQFEEPINETSQDLNQVQIDRFRPTNEENNSSEKQSMPEEERMVEEPAVEEPKKVKQPKEKNNNQLTKSLRKRKDPDEPPTGNRKCPHRSDYMITPDKIDKVKNERVYSNNGLIENDPYAAECNDFASFDASILSAPPVKRLISLSGFKMIGATKQEEETKRQVSPPTLAINTGDSIEQIDDIYKSEMEKFRKTSIQSAFIMSDGLSKLIKKVEKEERKIKEIKAEIELIGWVDPTKRKRSLSQAASKNLDKLKAKLNRKEAKIAKLKSVIVSREEALHKAKKEHLPKDHPLSKNNNFCIALDYYQHQDYVEALKAFLLAFKSFENDPANKFIIAKYIDHMIQLAFENKRSEIIKNSEQNGVIKKDPSLQMLVEDFTGHPNAKKNECVRLPEHKEYATSILPEFSFKYVCRDDLKSEENYQIVNNNPYELHHSVNARIMCEHMTTEQVEKYVKESLNIIDPVQDDKKAKRKKKKSSNEKSNDTSFAKQHGFFAEEGEPKPKKTKSDNNSIVEEDDLIEESTVSNKYPAKRKIQSFIKDTAQPKKDTPSESIPKSSRKRTSARG